MPISLIRDELGMTEEERKERERYSQAWDQMRSGEMLYEDAQGNTQFRANTPDMMNPRDQILEQSGYNAAQTMQRAPLDEAGRLVDIQNITGATMNVPQGYNQHTQQVQQQAQAYQNLDEADRIAIDMVASGKISPLDFYKEKKKDQREREKARLTAMVKLPFDRADMMSDGQSVPTSGAAIGDFMSGDASATFRDPTTRQIIQSSSTRTEYGGAGGGRPGSGGGQRPIDNKEWLTFLSRVDQAEDNLNKLADNDPSAKKASTKKAQRKVNELHYARGIIEDPELDIPMQRAASIARDIASSDAVIFGGPGDQAVMTDANGNSLLNVHGMMEIGGKRTPVRHLLSLIDPKTGKPHTPEKILNWYLDRATIGPERQ